MQAKPLCSPSGTDWYLNRTEDKFNCITSCQGIYADVSYFKENVNQKLILEKINKMYMDFKRHFTQNIQFDMEGTNFGKLVVDR